MYNTDSSLLERFKNKIQTEANNNDPKPLVYLTRNKTPITSQKYWEKQLITSTIGTRSSIAARRPVGSLLADMIFTSQIVGGNAIIKKAAPTLNINDMVWQTVTTLVNISELSLMFDGIMKLVEGKVETYTVGELPTVFYVTTSGSLVGLDLDTDTTFTISDDAVNIASVRGLYSEAIGLDDGIWCFYTNTAGELWEARVFENEVIELTQITMKPTGVTSWLDIWAGRTFDYRIVLQIKGNDGKVYTLLSASRPSGFGVGIEYVKFSSITATGKIGLIPPYLISAENVGV